MFEIAAAAAITQGNDWFVVKPALEKSIAWQNGATLLFTILSIAILFYAHRLAKRHGSSYPYWVVLGSALATYYEPLGDFLAHVTYHEVNQINFTTAFGFMTPLWVLPCYIVFFGYPILWLGEVITKDVSMGKWMGLFFAAFVSAWFFEVPILAMGATEYYGANQPFKLLNYPLWMGFANTATMFVVAAAVHHLKSTDVFARMPVLFAAVLPMLVTGANAGTALPLGSAINSTSDTMITNAMAVLSMALALLYTWIAGTLVVDKSGATVEATFRTAASRT